MTLEEAIATENTEEAERILLSQIEIEKPNKDLLVKLALTELQHPFHDPFRAMDYLREAMNICPNSSEVLILLAFIQWLGTGSVGDDLLSRLAQISDESPETLSLVRIVQSKNYMREDEKLEMRYLEEALHYSKEHPYPYYRMGQIFLCNGRADEAKDYFLMAKERVKTILTPETATDFTSPQAFIDEHISYKAQSTVNYERLCERCERCEKGRDVDEKPARRAKGHNVGKATSFRKMDRREPMIKKITVISAIVIGLLALCFFCCRESVTVENVLDEMYTSISVKNSERYTRASFYGFTEANFAKPETNVGQPWEEHLEYRLENGWMTVYFFRDMKMALDTLIVSNDGTRFRMYLNYDVKTKKIETSVSSNITDAFSVEYRELKQEAMDSTIVFLDRWIEVNEGDTIFCTGNYGNVFSARENTLVELHQYIDGFK